MMILASTVGKVEDGVLVVGMLRMAAIPSEIAFIYTESHALMKTRTLIKFQLGRSRVQEV